MAILRLRDFRYAKYRRLLGKARPKSTTGKAFCFDLAGILSQSRRLELTPFAWSDRSQDFESTIAVWP